MDKGICAVGGVAALPQVAAAQGNMPLPSDAPWNGHCGSFQIVWMFTLMPSVNAWECFGDEAQGLFRRLRPPRMKGRQLPSPSAVSYHPRAAPQQADRRQQNKQTKT